MDLLTVNWGKRPLCLFHSLSLPFIPPPSSLLTSLQSAQGYTKHILKTTVQKNRSATIGCFSIYQRSNKS